MPELPEVESFKKYFDNTSLNQTIKQVDVSHPTILGKVTEQELQRRLPGHIFEETKRHGKYLFTRMDNQLWLIFHFGMTGSLVFTDKHSELPSHTRFLITFDSGSFLAFNCPRMFGKLNLADDINSFIKGKKLGHDALTVDFTTFKTSLKTRRGAIKSVLMNQQVFAGVGNIYADEIMYQIGVHPTTPIQTLSPKHLKQMYDVMQQVLKTSIDTQANFEKLPNSYIILQRSKNGNCPKCSSNMESIKISGRTTYYCPICQQIPS